MVFEKPFLGLPTFSTSWRLNCMRQPKLVEAVPTAGILICPVAEIRLGPFRAIRMCCIHLAVENHTAINEPPGNPLREPIMLVPGHILHSSLFEVTPKPIDSVFAASANLGAIRYTPWVRNVIKGCICFTDIMNFLWSCIDK